MLKTPEKFQRVQIVSRVDHTDDLWSIRVQPEDRLAFKPGQYATLGVEEGAKLTERAYSIVSSPLEGQLEFFIELVPAGQLTPPLYRLQVGDTLWMRRQAKGLFTLDMKSGHRKHLMVATVTGIAPYLSTVRTLARETENGNPPNLAIVVLHAASRVKELAYSDELQAYAQRYPWLRYVPLVSRAWEEPEWKGETGRAEDVLRKYVDGLELHPAETTAYLCGHPQMIDNAKGILRRRGFSKEFVREEVYWLSRKEAT
jgi:ferredoxin--NADP+ reductase